MCVQPRVVNRRCVQECSILQPPGGASRVPDWEGNATASKPAWHGLAGRLRELWQLRIRPWPSAGRDPAAQDESELATVLAHEISHIIARHSAEKA